MVRENIDKAELTNFLQAKTKRSIESFLEMSQDDGGVKFTVLVKKRWFADPNPTPDRNRKFSVTYLLEMAVRQYFEKDHLSICRYDDDSSVMLHCVDDADNKYRVEVYVSFTPPSSEDEHLKKC